MSRELQVACARHLVHGNFTRQGCEECYAQSFRALEGAAAPSPDPVAEKLAELREYAAFASPGPWEQRSDGWTVRDANGDRICATFGAEDTTEQQVNDQRFIVAARNAMPALLDVAEAAQDRADCWEHAGNCCKDWCDGCRHGVASAERLDAMLARLVKP